VFRGKRLIGHNIRVQTEIMSQPHGPAKLHFCDGSVVISGELVARAGDSGA
jgi:hypothetical protein